MACLRYSVGERSRSGRPHGGRLKPRCLSLVVCEWSSYHSLTHDSTRLSYSLICGVRRQELSSNISVLEFSPQRAAHSTSTAELPNDTSGKCITTIHHMLPPRFRNFAAPPYVITICPSIQDADDFIAALLSSSLRWDVCSVKDVS